MNSVEFPVLLDPVDDLPPSTVIAQVRRPSPNNILVQSTTSDNETVTKVIVNGREATATRANFAEWGITLERTVEALEIREHAEDAAGNRELRPHVVTK